MLKIRLQILEQEVDLRFMLIYKAMKLSPVSQDRTGNYKVLRYVL